MSELEPKIYDAEIVGDLKKEIKYGLMLWNRAETLQSEADDLRFEHAKIAHELTTSGRITQADLAEQWGKSKQHVKTVVLIHKRRSADDNRSWLELYREADGHPERNLPPDERPQREIEQPEPEDPPDNVIYLDDNRLPSKVAPKRLEDYNVGRPEITDAEDAERTRQIAKKAAEIKEAAKAHEPPPYDFDRHFLAIFDFLWINDMKRMVEYSEKAHLRRETVEKALPELDKLIKTIEKVKDNINERCE